MALWRRPTVGGPRNLPPAGHSSGHRGESAMLGRVVEGFELEAVVDAPQGVQYELIGEPGVLGEQGAVQVGAVRVEPPRSFGAVFAIVAVAHDDPAQWLQAIAQVG